MTVDGKALAHELRGELKKRVAQFSLDAPPSLLVIVTQESRVTKSYISLKEKVAEELGIRFARFQLDVFGGTEDVVHEILHGARTHDGIVVQLPLVRTVEENAIKHIMPITHDVDVYGETAWAQYREGHLPILPPVVGAISDILHHNSLTVTGQKVVVVGDGWLVGKPAAVWAERMGAESVTVITKESNNRVGPLKDADLIISGAGHPGLITPDLVKEGVIILDAGTSEANGKLAGDVDPAVAEKARLMTPVPGGIGPVAITRLFDNLLTLKELREGVDPRLTD
ncbi:hypothetical protein GVX82_01765 [Patescibacteria group bacterium]|jgi:methylenetetrahydrofolate dehydrogenase (NADP+)/methenyltetrahydrofolate cyclohydrolase|nr:hypothetical protein [Patescibacteria group bacterium]